MQTSKELLGARIKEVRKGRRLSQEKLAEKVGVDPRYISRIELGKCYPSLDTLEIIARSLRVEMQNLFDFSHLKPDVTVRKEIGNLLKEVDDPDMQLLVLRIARAVAREVSYNV